MSLFGLAHLKVSKAAVLLKHCPIKSSIAREDLKGKISYDMLSVVDMIYPRVGSSLSGI